MSQQAMFTSRFDRRSVLIGLAAAGLVDGSASAGRCAADGEHLFTGGYLAEGAAGVRSLAGVAGSSGSLKSALVAEAVNASWIEHHPRLPLAYVVDERASGAVATYEVRPGRWHLLSRVATQGADPCHLALDPRGTLMAAANYSSGSVTLFRLDPVSGLPEMIGTPAVHGGSGPDRTRQAAPHAHWVGFSPDTGWLLAVDLGADAVFAHRLAPGGSFVGEPTYAFRAAPGAGPRHLAWHPRRRSAFLLNELANSVTVLKAGRDPELTATMECSTLPAAFTGESQAGAIVVNPAGTRLYASNRGHDSIAVFAISEDDRLTLLQHLSCGGRWPRHMRMLPGRRQLLVANQRSGTVAWLDVAPDGRLTPAGGATSSPGVAFIDLVTRNCSA